MNNNLAIDEMRPKIKIDLNGIEMVNNFITEESMREGLKENFSSSILFVRSADDQKTFCQGYNLKEVVSIRNYLNDLIDLAIDCM